MLVLAAVTPLLIQQLAFFFIGSSPDPLEDADDFLGLAGARFVSNDQIGHLCYGGGLEQPSQRQIDLERFAHPGEQPGRAQGVPAELEEVVIHADSLPAEYADPDTSQFLLDRRARRDELALLSLARVLRTGCREDVHRTIGAEA